MSSTRRMQILRAVVEDYIRQQEPIGSGALAAKHHLGVSPATIRNDMAALEDEGYLTQPHTDTAHRRATGINQQCPERFGEPAGHIAARRTHSLHHHRSICNGVGAVVVPVPYEARGTAAPRRAYAPAGDDNRDGPRGAEVGLDGHVAEYRADAVHMRNDQYPLPPAHVPPMRAEHSHAANRLRGGIHPPAPRCHRGGVLRHGE